MLSKIKIPGYIAKFIKNQVIDYMRFQLIKKADTNKSNSVQLSSDLFERELRNNICNLDKQVDNLEAVVFQGKRLFEQIIQQLSEMSKSNNSPNINIEGNVNIIINFSSGNIQNELKGDIPKEIKNIIDEQVNNLFEIVDSDVSGQKVLLKSNKISNKMAEIIDRGQEKLKLLRQED